jgi:hypothetical protein
MWETRNDVFNGCVLNFAVLGGPECLCVLLSFKRIAPGYQNNASVVVEGYSLGCKFLVMINELNLDK